MIHHFVYDVEYAVQQALGVFPARPAEAFRRTREVRRGAAPERGTSAPTGV